MTNAPYLLPKARAGYRMGDATLVDALIHDGLWEAYKGFHMGVGARDDCGEVWDHTGGAGRVCG